MKSSMQALNSRVHTDQGYRTGGAVTQTSSSDDEHQQRWLGEGKLCSRSCCSHCKPSTCESGSGIKCPTAGNVPDSSCGLFSIFCLTAQGIFYWGLDAVLACTARGWSWDGEEPHTCARLCIRTREALKYISRLWATFLVLGHWPYICKTNSPCW